MTAALVRAVMCPECALWYVRNTYSQQYERTASDRAFGIGPLAPVAGPHRTVGKGLHCCAATNGKRSLLKTITYKIVGLNTLLKLLDP